MKSEIWYHATTLENLNNIISSNSFKLLNPRNGNFLGRGIYFTDTPASASKYGAIIIKCNINMDSILYSELGIELISAIETFTGPQKERGDYLKNYFVGKNFKGINFPFNKLLDGNRKLVIYDLSLITIEGVIYDKTQISY